MSFCSNIISSHHVTKSRRSVGMGSGLTGTGLRPQRPGESRAQHYYLERTLGFPSRRRKDWSITKLLSLERALASGMVDSCLVEQGLGTRPKAQLSLWWELRTPQEVPVHKQGSCWGFENKCSTLAELCLQHGQVDSRALIRVQAGDIPQELKALCLLFFARMREA